MKAKLIVIGGATSATEVNLRLPTIIGRGRSAQVTIPHSLVSRQHCEICEDEGRLVVRDLDSLNGTYVGDERITETFLAPGALLTVGTVTFRAAYEVGDKEGWRDEDVTDATCRTGLLSSKAAESFDSHQAPIAEAETVPVAPALFSESLHPPRVLDAREASEDTDTAQVSDLLGEPSLESAAPNSD